MLKERDFEAENRQFRIDIQRFGWLNVLAELTDLDKAISSFRQGQGSKKGDFCPHHDSKSGTKFRLQKTAEEDGSGYCYVCRQRWDGFGHIMAAQRCDFGDACRLIKELIYDADGQPKIYKGTPEADSRRTPEVKKVPQGPSKADIKMHEKVMANNKALWDSSVPLENPEAALGRMYFEHRSIFNYASLGGNVRFNPRAEYTLMVPTETKPEKMQEYHKHVDYLRTHPYYDREWETPDGDIVFYMGYHPCLVFLMRNPDDFQPRTIQRIYLSQEGKKIEFDGMFDMTAKKRMPASPLWSAAGSAVLIDPPGSPVIGVAEGPETALAVRGCLDIPMHCCVDAYGLEQYLCVGGTYVVIIFVDKDRSRTGELAAEKLAERLRAEHVEVILAHPPLDLPDDAKSVDWQDAVEQLGSSAFNDTLSNWERLI
ncbi:toprim domain-containing protein [Vibrio agarivorans]|uniref:Toprim domain-containing protein n=1 Tax=Vibrio agarivorans TaxID=153622 RepID=A0ABT7Y7C3_9VIBR|nr:toprim domain-containing protein [Vibrio agarivorans]MDN2483957.1 toprim domain-containing protein [Vibrio agarivorans]